METKRVSPQQAHELVEGKGYIYLDVRSIPEFEGGHPSGAYNVPLMHIGKAGMEPNRDFLDVVRANFSTEAKLIVGCKNSDRAREATRQLLGAGYRTVLLQRAGFDGVRDAFGQVTEPGWESNQLPVSQDPEPDRSYAALASNAVEP